MANSTTITRQGVKLLSVWKRGFLEINAEILSCLKQGFIQRTQICQKCNMDSRAAKKYLTILESVELIQPHNGDGTSFEITDKGIKYLDRFNSLVDMIEYDLENSIKPVNKKKRSTLL
jgi:predicted transcriptional regulator